MVVPSYPYGYHQDGYRRHRDDGDRDGDRKDGDKDKESKRTGRLPSQGEVFVYLPANASLSVNGEPTRLNSDEQRIVTPRLEEGKDYYYTLRAKLVQDGRVIEKEKRVLVRAGQRSNVDFSDLPATATARR